MMISLLINGVATYRIGSVNAAADVRGPSPEAKATPTQKRPRNKTHTRMKLAERQSSDNAVTKFPCMILTVAAATLNLRACLKHSPVAYYPLKDVATYLSRSRLDT